MKILVTGGAGYIGSHTVLDLLNRGYDVAVFDSLEVGHKESLDIIQEITGKEIPFYQGNLLNYDDIDNAIADFKPEGIIHFAAYALVGESVTDPNKYYRNNIVGGLNILDAMKNNGVQNLVFSSTCAIYGQPEIVPMTEDLPKAPINPYGDSKLMFEKVLENATKAYNIKFVALRYFNACGCEEQGRIGEDHTIETHLIPLIMDAALGRRESIAIYGIDYDTPDGTCIRDYIHVLDLSDAHIKALEYLKENGESTSINLGTSNGSSVREIIEAVKKASGKDFKVTETDRRPGDPAKLIANNQKAKQVLGWEPKYGLEEIIESAWKWETGKGKYNY
jgi:UDP-glucose 4-epimerase